MGRRRVVGPRCDTGVKAADFILALTLFGGQGYRSVWWETGAQQRWPHSPAAAYLTVLLSRSPRDGRVGESPGYEQTHRLFYQYHRSRSGTTACRPGTSSGPRAPRSTVERLRRG